MTITPAGCIASIFRRLDVYHGFSVLEQIDQYWNLCHVLLDAQVSPVDRFYQWSVCKQTHGTVGTRTGAFITSAAGASKRVHYTTTLLSGVVCSLSRCYIPLFCIIGCISFWLTLDRPLAFVRTSGYTSCTSSIYYYRY